jgi:hypothetical protein
LLRQAAEQYALAEEQRNKVNEERLKSEEERRKNAEAQERAAKEQASVVASLAEGMHKLSEGSGVSAERGWLWLQSEDFRRFQPYGCACRGHHVDDRDVGAGSEQWRCRNFRFNCLLVATYRGAGDESRRDNGLDGRDFKKRQGKLRPLPACQ